MSLGEVVAALWSGPDWGSVGITDIGETLVVASKQRHEIRDGRIRAVYGYSLLEHIKRTPTTPPDLLYHGTFPDNLEHVMREGLLPMSRQFVHLPADVGITWAMGSRHTSCLVVLHIDATAAYAADILFYKGDDKVWSVDEVPPRFVTAQILTD